MPDQTKGFEMYFSETTARSFAEHEQNEKNFRVAAIVDKLLLYQTADVKRPFYAADLGGGAHPDRYHAFFTELLQEPKGQMDWVDVSPLMLQLAKEYLKPQVYNKRLPLLSFIHSDIFTYLKNLPDNTLDVAIMKYTFDHLQDIDTLFSLLAKKLKKNGSLVSTMTMLRPELKSVSTNARFFYQGKPFPENETRTLQDGESFTIKFYKTSGHPELGFIDGGETTKYYHSPAKIASLAKKHDFTFYLGDWKNYLPKSKHDNEAMNLDVLILQSKLR